MSLNRWFVWLCLALMLVLEISVYRSNREKDALQNQLNAALEQLHQARSQLADTTNNTAELRDSELSRLRRINTILTNKVNYIQAAIYPLLLQNQSNSEHLAIARLALSLQQDHIRDLADENQQITDVSLAIINQKTCINNLRLIDDAKQQWAADYGQPNDARPTVKDLRPYFQNQIFPACPDGGTYSLNAVDQVPTCSIPTHTLPQ